MAFISRYTETVTLFFRTMWSIVYKVLEEEYDAIPNSWLLNEESALYPDKSTSTTNRLAKEAAPPEVDWLRITITVKKRDCGKYFWYITQMLHYIILNNSYSATFKISFRNTLLKDRLNITIEWR